MKIDFQSLFKCVIGTVVLIAALVLAQMWFNVFSIAFFWKALATLAILGGLASLLIAIKQDMVEEKKMRDDKFIS